MTHDEPSDTPDEQVGPEETADDSTQADMGLGGPPASSATPVGQGDEPGLGASEHGTPPDEDDNQDRS